MDLIGKLLVFLVGVLSSVLANELKDWTPWIVQRLIRYSAARLPEDRQERFQEEWTSHVCEVPGDAGKIVVALGFLWAALRMSWILGVAYERDLFAGRISRAPLPILASAPGIWCDAPVALPAHRMLAAVADGSVVAIAMGLFLGIFRVFGGPIVFTEQSMVLFGGMVLLVWLFYGFLWSLGNGESPGMRLVGLRLVTFAGEIPGPDQLRLRQAAHLMSWLSAGLGLVWALVDEEELTWHDHISKTFPTPCDTTRRWLVVRNFPTHRLL